MVVFSFSACGKKDKKLAEVETQTDASGKAYVEVTDKGGEVVTDAEGVAQTSKLSDKEEEKISKAKSEKAKENGDKEATEKNSTVAGGLEVNTDVLNKLEDESIFDNVGSSKEDLYDEGTATKKTSLFEDNVAKVMKTGKFTLELNSVSGDTKTPMKMVFDNDKIYLSTAVSGIEAGILFMDGKGYMTLPNMFKGVKVYMDWPEDMGEPSDILGSFDQISETGNKYVGSSTVKVGSKNYTCEEYKAEDGSTVKYYFDGGAWKRFESISDDETVVFDVTNFTGKVDSSVFSLKGYIKLTNEMLAGMNF